ncbi:MAG: MMPL family transporter [Candidatus Binatia bacterium]
MERDLQRFVPLSIALVVIVLAWEFRTWRGVLLPLGAVIIGVVWTVGVMVLAGSSINMGTLILPPLLMAIGIAYAVHVVTATIQELEHIHERAAVVDATVRHIRVPSSITWLTTTIGCATLAITPIPAIRDFGVYSALGVTLTWLVSMTFVPAMLLLLPDARLTEHQEERRPPQRVARVGRSLRRAPAASDHGGERAGVRSSALRRDRSSRSRPTTCRSSDRRPSCSATTTASRSTSAARSRCTSYSRPTSPDACARCRRSRRCATCSSSSRASPASTPASRSRTTSSSCAARSIDSPPGLPEQQRDVDQLLLFDPTDLAPVVARDWSRASVVVRTRLSGSAEIAHLVDRIVEYAAQRLPGGLHLHPTGSVVLLSRSARHARARTGDRPLAGADRSPAGDVGSVPVVPHGAAVAGAERRADPRAVRGDGLRRHRPQHLDRDDRRDRARHRDRRTIHYFNDFKLQIRETGDVETAIIRVVSSVGRPIVFTAGALCAAFLILTLSSFQPIRQFGMLAGFTMVIDLIAELLITPGLVVGTTIITLWDLLFVRLGRARTRRSAVRRAASVPGAHRRADGTAALGAGRHLHRAAQRAQGRDVRAAARTRRRARRPAAHADPLDGTRRRARRDGLVRARPRTADVVVVRDAEYLVLDEGFLNRLQRRHPRIAAKVFLNPTRILSDRLEHTTDQLVDERSHAAESATG